ncbi:MAG: hypothetical protein R2856_00465 [Caldilineaceae bacterium]
MGELQAAVSDLSESSLSVQDAMQQVADVIITSRPPHRHIQP